MTEGQFYAALKTRYEAKSYALLPQVRNGTGYQKRIRTADAIAVSLWPSRGLYAEGFEFKDSRADWLKELAEPAKAEEISRFCRHWWIVVSDATIVRAGELPPTWGLMLAEDDKVKILTPAPANPDVQAPGWAFAAAVLRAAVPVVTPEADIERRIATAVAKEADRCRASHEDARRRDREAAKREADELRAKVRAFEEASGVQIDTWRHGHPEKVGAAVRFLVEGGLAGQLDSLRRLADQCGSIKTYILAAIGEAAER